MKILIIIALFYFFGCIETHAMTAFVLNNGADANICFTPGEDCEGQIIEAIHLAKKTIDVQAYRLTSHPIRVALEDAQSRGIKVIIMLDKQGKEDLHWACSVARLETLRDSAPRIAHNKIIIIDDRIVITGSFNFTESAQKYNAENVLMIEDSRVGEVYKMNFLKRMGESDLCIPDIIH